MGKEKKKTTAMLAEDRSLVECDKLCWTELTAARNTVELSLFLDHSRGVQGLSN